MPSQKDKAIKGKVVKQGNKWVAQKAATIDVNAAIDASHFNTTEKKDLKAIFAAFLRD